MSNQDLTHSFWPGFEKQLRRLGRWYPRRLAQLGVPKMIGFMEGRVLTFTTRRSRARRLGQTLRVQWLTSRIKRWEAGIRWLRQHADRLGQHVIEQLDARAKAEKFSWDARSEDFDRWRAKRASATNKPPAG